MPVLNFKVPSLAFIVTESVQFRFGDSESQSIIVLILIILFSDPYIQ